MIYVGALLLGFVSGLRAFTSIAALYLSRGGIPAIVAPLFALGEYVADLMPSIPPRTGLPSIVIRPLSGAFVGWTFASMHGGSAIAGCVLGIIGAFAGTYGGHAARIAAIARIGAIPAGLLEDAVAIIIAACVLFTTVFAA